MIRNQKYVNQDITKILDKHQKYHESYDDMIKDGTCPMGTPLFICRNTRNWTNKPYFERLKSMKHGKHYTCSPCLQQVGTQIIRHNVMIKD